MIVNNKIDGGKGFDWGRTSLDYAKYRDIYPQEFYEYLLRQNLCAKNQKVLDIGTGTGVLPRNLYRYGAQFVGMDISENQIEQARVLAGQTGMDIKFISGAAEEAEFEEAAFDVVTACQCFTYFQHEKLAETLNRVLKPEGRLAVLYMAWLPFEDKIAGASEKLVLQYNPEWTGCGETRHPIIIPDVYHKYFELIQSDVFDVYVPFDREAWNGRMKSCRGIGASLTADEAGRFEQEHKVLLENIAPEEFPILHYVAAAVLKKLS